MASVWPVFESASKHEGGVACEYTTPEKNSIIGKRDILTVPARRKIFFIREVLRGILKIANWCDEVLPTSFPWLMMIVENQTCGDYSSGNAT